MTRILASLRPFLAMIVFLVPVWLGIWRSQQREREWHASQQTAEARQRAEAAADLERAVKSSALNRPLELRLGGRKTAADHP